MSFEPQLTPKKQIRNLLLILSGGVGCAILLTLFMLYNYNPTGHYLLKNALLSPEVISQLSLQKNGKKSPSNHVFNNIEFSLQDVETKKRTHFSVDKETYSNFYQNIANDKNILDVPTDVPASFNQMPVSSLVITIQNENNKENNQKINFQEVQFLYKGDYYRVQLRETSGVTNWIYFYHPHVYEDTLILFTSQKA